MEGAVSTGLLAAEAIRHGLGLADPIEVLKPAMPARWMWQVLKVVSWPLSAILGAFSRSRDRSSDED